MKSKKPASNRRKRHAVLEPELALRNIAMPLHANSSGDIFWRLAIVSNGPCRRVGCYTPR
jgi:hypothetical protein